VKGFSTANLIDRQIHGRSSNETGSYLDALDSPPENFIDASWRGDAIVRRCRDAGRHELCKRTGAMSTANATTPGGWMKTLLRWALRRWLRVEVTGDVTALSGRRVLIVANHPSAYDGLLLALCLPVSPVVVLPREDKRHWLMRLAAGFIEHQSWDMNHPMTVKKVLRLLEQGRPVALFPEGRVARAGNVMKIYEGAALIAFRSGAMLVPVHLEGARHGFSHGLSGGRVSLRVHPAVRVDTPAGCGPRQRRELGARELGRIMQAATFHSHVPKGLFDAFLDAVEREGRRTEILEDMNEEPKTYGELLKASLAIGRWIGRRTDAGETVGVLLPNLFVSVGVVLALQCKGRVPAMLNYTGGPRGIEASRAAAALKTVITSRRFVEQAALEPLIAVLGGVNILYVEDIRAQFGILDKLWLMAWALHFPRRVRVPVNPHASAAILFTSGSEGKPKGVALSHAGIQANILQIRTVIDFTPADKVLNALPMYHAYSFTAGVMLCLLTGTRLFLYISPLRYRAIPEIAYRRDATYLFGTSTFLGFYARHAHAGDFGTLRYVISGGEKLGEDVAKLWQEKFGLRIFEGYGGTECTVISLSTPLSYRPGCVGRVLPGLETRLEPMDGIDRGGVLHVRGPSVMLGYLQNDAPGQVQPPGSVFGEGWHRTGDVVDIDEDGFVRIAGRVKRFAKIAGEMVSLDQVERVAAAVSPAHQHAAVLKLEAAGGETTVLFTTDPTLHRGLLQKGARASGAPDLAVARGIIRVAEIPLLGNGKTDYVRLMDLVNDTALWNTRAGEPVQSIPSPARS
jgi:acyl-[acyl-carrier-protein]-phospholipid O-acyltransferase/long-chain-fatty-acid--[acyl-carrier-protein] ligase